MTPLQDKELAILKEIIKICYDHNLMYFAIGGTCLGAVRHGGFIPWDDDIDIAMPRNDYEMFRSEYYKELPCHLKKLDYDNSRSYNFPFFKIHDDRTTQVEYTSEYMPDRFTGAFVDIMPIDGAPDDKKEMSIFLSKLFNLSIMNNRVRPFYNYKNQHFGLIKLVLKELISEVHRYNEYTDKMYKLCSQYNCFETNYVLFSWRIGYVDNQRLIYKKEMFEKTTFHKFENIMIKLPEQYDLYLKQDFGDYMFLPPENQRNSGHNVYISDMEKPCNYYANLEKERIKKSKGVMGIIAKRNLKRAERVSFNSSLLNDKVEKKH